MNKESLQKIMKAYNQLEKNVRINTVVDDAYEALPKELQSSIITPIGKIQAINRYVITNYNNIMNDINSSNEPDVLDVVQEIIKPKRTRIKKS